MPSDTILRAFQFSNSNKLNFIIYEEDLSSRRPFLTIFLSIIDQVQDFLGLTRLDVDTRRKGNILLVLGNILGNFLDLLDTTGIFEGIFDSRALNEYNFDQFDPLLGLLPEFILLKIADLVATPCLFANLIAADNELLADACEFFQNLDKL